MPSIIDTFEVQNHCRKVKAAGEQGKEGEEEEKGCDIIVHGEERKMSSLFDVFYWSPSHWFVIS